MSDAGNSASDSPRRCPNCGSEVAPEAALCVACGYHLTLGYFLSTSIEQPQLPQPDDNPYAAPVPWDADERDPAMKSREPPDFDLTEQGARRARRVVADAKRVYLAIFLTMCLCSAGWLFLLPWYAYRLRCWHQLNSEFAELRNPNSFSEYGQLAADFQEARSRLLVGLVLGLVYAAFVALFIFVNLTRH